MGGPFNRFSATVNAIVRLARLRRRPGRSSPWAFFRDTPRVLPYLRPHKKLAAGSLSLVGLSVLVALAAPWPLALMIDVVLGNQPLPSLLGPLEGAGTYTLLIIAVLAGLLITGLQGGLAVVDDYVNTKLDQSMVLDLRSDLFSHAQRLSMAFHDKKRTGHLMFQINNQAAAVGSLTTSIPPLIQSFLTLIGMFFIVLKIQTELALLALSVVPLIYYSAGYYVRKIHPRVIEVRHLEGQSLSVVHEAMSMLRVIVAFGREKHEYSRFREQAEAAVDARVRLTVQQTMFSLAVTVITAIGTALVLGFGAHYVIQGQLTAGELLVVMGYIASLYKPLEQISNTVSGLQEQFLTLRGALDLLDSSVDIEQKPDAKEVGRATGRVTFEGVNFHYGGRTETLKDVSFDARAGMRVAIVGPTGAGKSTLLSLIPRFYDPMDGRLLLDGHDLRDLTLDSLRAQISVVLQEPLLFSGSIRDNIRYGSLEASDDDVEAAAEAANAHDFVSQLPQAYDTMLGERGAHLSGGERQRVSVARAFLKDAPILILDEPTSSIDSKTEGVILEALERLMEGRTTFMVAHRLSTIRDSDLILVMNHGEIAEHGTHDELIHFNGLYKQLHDAQNGSRRQRAAAALSPDDLEEMTRAVTEGRESGCGLSGPALAELSRAMATRDGADGELSGSWKLLAAAWPLLKEGRPDRLRELATNPNGADEAQEMARELMRDLGLPETQEPAAVNGANGNGNGQQ